MPNMPANANGLSMSSSFQYKKIISRMKETRSAKVIIKQWPNSKSKLATKKITQLQKKTPTP